MVNKLKSWKIAKFNPKVIKSINFRDKICILCKLNNKLSRINDRHHIYFWLQAEVKEWRNDTNKGIWVCRDCHKDIHSCRSWEWSRQQVIDYIINYYNDKN